MIFYDDPFIKKLAEEHAASVTKLNDAQTERVMESYSRTRQKLRGRLDNMASTDTFTAQRMRSTLVQVDGALKKMSDQLNDDMGTAAQDMSELAVQHLVDEITNWDDYYAGAAAPMNIDISEAASDAVELLVNNYETSIQNWTAQQRGLFAQGLSDGVIGGSTSDEVIRTLAQQIQAVEWKLRRVVRTEIQGIYSRAKLNTMGSLVNDDTIPDLMKTVWNPEDSRTAKDSYYVQERIDDYEDPKLIVGVDEYFEYKWQGKTRRYMSPPDRPNDRSILLPYRKKWELKYKDEEAK